MNSPRTRGTAAAAALLLLALASPRGQDTSIFLERPPAAGSWAKYRVTTQKAGEQARSKPLNLAVISEGATAGTASYTLEIGPTKFAGYKDGILRLTLKKAATAEEVLNPFLQALAVAYQEPDGPPFKLSASAMDTLHEKAREAKAERKRTDLGPEKAEDASGKTYPCTRARLVSTRSAKYLFKSWKSTEDGVYWFSEETPFRMVRAEIDVVELSGGKEKKKHVSVLLKESGGAGAATKFTVEPSKEKGVLGLLFH